jgi:hypothetical protein
MGHQTAVEISESGLTLEQQLDWHLRGNHYPPIPSVMVGVCIEAIELANQGEWATEIKLPEHNGKQITYKGSDTAPVSALIEQHHLDAFLDTDFEDEDY